MQRIFRVALATLVVAAIGLQFVAEIHREGFDPVNFVSFFTIVANLIGAVVLAAAAFGLPARAGDRDRLRGAATLYLAIVGVVFSALLANVDSPLVPWVNLVVHFVMPLAIVADWYVDPPRTRLGPRDALTWLVLPLVYVAYTLARGAFAHWYPYPFLNPTKIGYAAVAAYVAAIAAFTIVAAYVVIAVGDRRRARLART